MYYLTNWICQLHHNSSWELFMILLFMLLTNLLKAAIWKTTTLTVVLYISCIYSTPSITYLDHTTCWVGKMIFFIVEAAILEPHVEYGHWEREYCTAYWTLPLKSWDHCTISGMVTMVTVSAGRQIRWHWTVTYLPDTRYHSVLSEDEPRTVPAHWTGLLCPTHMEQTRCLMNANSYAMPILRSSLHHLEFNVHLMEVFTIESCRILC